MPNKLIDFLKKWKLDSLKINAQFLEVEFSLDSSDREAAWEMYVELLTRVTTQALQTNHGDEGSALTSVYSIFRVTREILKKYGASNKQFQKLAILILNQKIRPFTAKWHPVSLQENGLKERADEFRHELAELQVTITHYARALADMAGVEDLTGLEDTSGE